jgi:hypothetical protein
VERLSQHATPIQDGVEDLNLVFSKSFFKIKIYSKAFTHILGVYGGLKEAKKPEVGIGIFGKNRHFTPF